MTASQVWNDINSKAMKRDFEVRTTTQNKRKSLWFRVFMNNNSLVISRALLHQPSVGLQTERKITFKDFEYVYSYYDAWIKGEAGVRDEVRAKSQNTTYIFALIANYYERRSSFGSLG